MTALQFPTNSAFLVLRDANQYGQYIGFDLRGSGIELQDDGRFLRLTFSSAVAAPGNNTELVFNDSGSLGADSGLSYDKALNRLRVLGGVDYGTDPATFGDSCYTNNWFLWWRNDTDDQNVKVLGVDDNGIIQLGNSSGYPIVINASVSDDVTIVAQVLNIATNGMQVGSDTSNFGGGVGVIGVTNASLAPSSNPTGGGILYTEGGAGKWRGSGGTITTFGPAEPHCPTCGRDFSTEHRNDDLGEHLAICLPCLVDALQASGLDITRFATVNKRGATREQWEANRAASQEREKEAREREKERKRNLTQLGEP